MAITARIHCNRTSSNWNSKLLIIFRNKCYKLLDWAVQQINWKIVLSKTGCIESIWWIFLKKCVREFFYSFTTTITYFFSSLKIYTKYYFPSNWFSKWAMKTFLRSNITDLIQFLVKFAHSLQIIWDN